MRENGLFMAQREDKKKLEFFLCEKSPFFF